MFNRETIKKINTLVIDSTYISELSKMLANRQLPEEEKSKLAQELLAAIHDAKDSLSSIERYFVKADPTHAIESI